MMQQDFISIGILGKPHGTSGAFHFKLTSLLQEEADFPETVYLKTREGMLPFFVEEWSLKNDTQGTISFEEIDSREKGVTLVNTEMLLKPDVFEECFEAEVDSVWLNYSVVDVLHGALGKIVEVTDNTMQEVAVVQHGEHQIMFPLVDAFIVNADDASKTLTVQLPDGLIEAYTTHSPEENDED